MNKVFTKDQIDFIKEQRLIYTNREYIAKAFFKKYGLRINVATIARHTKDVYYKKSYKNQVFDDDLREKIIEHYENGLKTSEIARLISEGREVPITSQQVSNQISTMGIRSTEPRRKEIYKDPQDYKQHQTKLQLLKNSIALGDYIEAHKLKYDGYKSKTIKKYEVIGIFEHYVNVRANDRVVAYYWDDIIKLYKAKQQ